jgi:antitoxin component of MazEF toxin-antitoxin module
MMLWCNPMPIADKIKVSIRRWGNSLAVRIPHEVVQRFHIRQDEVLSMEVVDDGESLILKVSKKSPLPKP